MLVSLVFELVQKGWAPGVWIWSGHGTSQPGMPRHPDHHNTLEFGAQYDLHVRHGERLYLSLYHEVAYRHNEHQKGQILVATGTFEYWEMTCEMRDINGQLVARVKQLERQYCARPVAPPAPKDAARWIQETATKLDTMRREGWEVPLECTFRSVKTQAGPIPLVAWPYTILSTDYADPKIVQSLHQLYDTVAAMNAYPSGFQSCPVPTQAHWLGEMMTLCMHTMVYETDHVQHHSLMHEHSREVCDQWVRLHTFPDPGKALFDCEDGALACMEWYCALVSVGLDPRDRLIPVQQFARRYLPCLTIGVLKEDDTECCPHVYLLLLDKGWVRRNTASKSVFYTDDPLPTIVCESTVHIDPVWTEFTTTNQEQSRYDEVYDLVENQPWHQWMSIRCPAARVCSSGMYMDVSTLLVLDLENRQACHWLLRHEKKLGVPFLDLVLHHSDRVEFFEMHRLGFHELRNSDIEWASFSQSVVPSTPKQSPRLAPIPSGAIAVSFSSEFLGSRPGILAWFRDKFPRHEWSKQVYTLPTNREIVVLHGVVS